MTLPRYTIALLGAGHTNAHVLRMWKMEPIPDARLVCVSNFHTATYSGMLPGTLAGLYTPDRMEIDLVRLCKSVNAELIVDTVTGLDLDARKLLFQSRAPLAFDVLSVGIGSIPAGLPAQPDPALIPIKPMQTFLNRLESRLREREAERNGGPLRIAVVGAGVAGIEISLALPPRLRKWLGHEAFEITLWDHHDDPFASLPAGRDVLQRELAKKGIRICSGEEIRQVTDGCLETAQQERFPVDAVLWATSATAPPLLRQFGLPTDERGFLLTQPTLQSVAADDVFAVGDSGTMQEDPSPKAGVYAVRQGSVLWRNIRSFLQQQPLREYRPQRGFLKLVSTGDERAVLMYRGVSAVGRWCWRLKDYIDARFMAKYQDYRPMDMSTLPTVAAEPTMHCAGCGSKVGAEILSRVLSRLEIARSPHVLLGLHSPDDAAIVHPPEGRPTVVTTDFFISPLADAYLAGRIAALNALSDAFAMGARPFAALAMVTLPYGRPREQEALLEEILAGGLREFHECDVSLTGGHTIEGEQFTLGYTILADAGPAPPHTKAGLQAGDVLLLTKPLGTGVLLAAHQQAACRAPWFEAMVNSMLQSNACALAMRERFDLHGMTDVTGFGLAGHLQEMLRASQVHASLELREIPLLPGAAELLKAGFESTLSPANRAAAAIRGEPSMESSAGYAALFDPQTSGGLLLGVPEREAEQAVVWLQSQGHHNARAIGHVFSNSGEPAIHLEETVSAENLPKAVSQPLSEAIDP